MQPPQASERREPLLGRTPNPWPFRIVLLMLIAAFGLIVVAESWPLPRTCIGHQATNPAWRSAVHTPNNLLGLAGSISLIAFVASVGGVAAASGRRARFAGLALASLVIAVIALFAQFEITIPCGGFFS